MDDGARIWPGCYELLTSGLPPRAQQIWSLLASHRHNEPGHPDDGCCNVSVPFMAGKAHCSLRQVFEALATLRIYGWLRQGRKNSRQRFRPLIGRPLLPDEIKSE